MKKPNCMLGPLGRLRRDELALTLQDNGTLQDKGMSFSFFSNVTGFRNQILPTVVR